MAPKTRRHRCGTKLRHCHLMIIRSPTGRALWTGRVPANCKVRGLCKGGSAAAAMRPHVKLLCALVGVILCVQSDSGVVGRGAGSVSRAGGRRSAAHENLGRVHNERLHRCAAARRQLRGSVQGAPAGARFTKCLTIYHTIVASLS